jgi:TonB family protein
MFAVVAVLIGIGVYAVMTVLLDEGPKKKSPVTTVTLLKPPPPPEIKPKLPEPEVPKEAPKEQIIDPGPKEPQNDAPAGDKLSLDAEGAAGSDGFGLGAKKGGRGILGGDGMGKYSLLSKYAGYTKLVEGEIRKRVMKRLDQEGGIPKGKLQTVVQVSVDTRGTIVSFKIIGSSGNNRLDDAVKDSLGQIRISEPPPDGMPKTMSVRISSQS